MQASYMYRPIHPGMILHNKLPYMHVTIQQIILNLLIMVRNITGHLLHLHISVIQQHICYPYQSAQEL